MRTNRDAKGKKDEGSWGENVTCDYLKRLGFRIIARNWRYGHAELDIIALYGDRIHVIEVKTRREGQVGYPSELIRPKQQEAILRAADAYARFNHWVKGIQIDLILITLQQNSYTITPFPNAILPSF
jgi:UPF0102 protein dde_1093